MKRLSLSQLLPLTALGFALGLLSATLEPALLGYKVLELAPERRNTALGFTTFVGLMVAILTQPIIGALSDRTRSHCGRRLPYFVTGTALANVCLIWLASTTTYAFFLASVVVLQLASNTIQGPWQALIPDHVPDQQRGLASGMKVLIEGSAAVVGRLIAGQIMGHVGEWGSAAIVAAIAIPSIGLIAAVIITARGIPDSLPNDPGAQPQSIRAVLFRTFSIDLRAYPAFGWWFLNRLLFWCAVISVSIFLLFFAIDVVGLSSDAAQRYIGQMTVVLGAALLVCALPASRLADRISRKRLVFFAGCVACLGTSIVLITRDLTVMTIGGAVIGAGVGIYLIANWALITEIVPRAEAARYLGVANVATAGGSAIARLLGGMLIDSLNAATGSSSIGYLTLYAIAAGLFLLSALAMIPLHSISRPTDAK